MKTSEQKSSVNGFWPFLILAVSVGLRCIGLQRPLLGNFSIYQTAQAMIARFFAENHFETLLMPQVNVLITGKPGLILLYYPVSSLMAAGAYSFFGGSLEVWGRVQAILFFALSALFLYKAIKRFLSVEIALVSLLVFCLSPLTIIYGQSFQNEMATVFFTVLSFYGLVRFLEKERLPWLVLSAIAMSGVLITRPNNLFIFVPFVFLILQHFHRKKEVVKGFFLVVLHGLVSVFIPALWFYHVWKVSYAETNIYSTLYAQLMVRSSFASPLVFQMDYYRELFDVFAGIVLTPIGFTFFLFGLGLAFREVPRMFFFVLWCLVYLAAMLLIPRKLLEHNFYWLHFIIPAAPVIACGVAGLWKGVSEKLSHQRGFIGFLVLVCFFVSMRYALNPTFKTPVEDQSIIRLAEQVKKYTDRDQDRIITQGIHHLLYYADRYGWPFTIDRGEKLSDYYSQMNWEKMPEDKWKRRNEAYQDPIKMIEYLRAEEGATHFVMTHPQKFEQYPEFALYMRENYPVTYQESHSGAIFNLREKLKYFD